MMVHWLKQAYRLIRTCLGEIFDEAAYERFLNRHSLPSGSQSYYGFCAEQAMLKSRRPRCC